MLFGDADDGRAVLAERPEIGTLAGVGSMAGEVRGDGDHVVCKRDEGFGLDDGRIDAGQGGGDFLPQGMQRGHDGGGSVASGDVAHAASERVGR